LKTNKGIVQQVLGNSKFNEERKQSLKVFFFLLQHANLKTEKRKHIGELSTPRTGGAELIAINRV
jgi:hypothetical protein